MGRNRRRLACIMAFSLESPAPRNFWSASSSRIPFLATMPTTMIMPINEEILNVVRVTRRAIKTPEVDNKADARMAMGATNVRNSNSNTMKTSTTARIRTKIKSRNDFCCSW